MMSTNLDEKSLDYVAEDGLRFGQQFIGFLVQKYGSKIYFLFHSQLKYEKLSDRLSDEISNIFAHYIKPKDLENYSISFFEAVLLLLEEQGMDV